MPLNVIKQVIDIKETEGNCIKYYKKDESQDKEILFILRLRAS